VSGTASGTYASVGLEHDLKCTHRTLDVLQRESTKVAELRLCAINHDIVGDSGNDDAARFGDPFKCLTRLLILLPGI
jgi:hypothetical protein